MPDEVACPDPDELVTRKILSDVLEEQFATFEAKLDKKLDEKLEKLTQHLHDELARLVRGSEEALRKDLRGALEPLSDVPKRVRDHEAQLERLDDHETRITVLESRPAKQVRKPRTRKRT